MLIMRVCESRRRMFTMRVCDRAVVKAYYRRAFDASVSRPYYRRVIADMQKRVYNDPAFFT